MRLCDYDLMDVDKNGDVLFGGDFADGLTNEDFVNYMNYLLRDRGRRSLRKETADIYASIIRIFSDTGPPMTVRQMFYALVSSGVVDKTEKDYKRVCYHLLRLRRIGVVPYTFIADNTRWMRKPTTYNGIREVLEITKRAYRRVLWADQDAYVEVWVEKDALAGVLYGITSKWDVPLMVTRGFPSDSFLYEAAETLKGQASRKSAYVYYFGDHDPSGSDIAKSTERKLKEFGATFKFEVVAVLPWQIAEYNLPMRPTKKSSHSKSWKGGSVELDAIPVKVLREMCEWCISMHIDEEVLDRTMTIEKAERETMELIAATWG
jgi:hypothetical protein